MTDSDLEALWKMFGDIPINDDDEILEPFLHFESGTDRFDVWSWFDSRHSKGVYKLVYPYGDEGLKNHLRNLA